MFRQFSTIMLTRLVRTASADGPLCVFLSSLTNASPQPVSRSEVGILFRLPRAILWMKR